MKRTKPLRSSTQIKRVEFENKASDRHAQKRRKKPGGQPSTAYVQRLFNDSIKQRDNFICVRCHGDFSERRESLHASHFFNVRKSAVRFDMENVDALCEACHLGRDGWEYHKNTEYRAFKIAQLGPERFAQLEARAREKTKLYDAKREFIEGKVAARKEAA